MAHCYWTPSTKLSPNISAYAVTICMVRIFSVVPLMSGWPSGLRRQTQGNFPSLEGHGRSGPRMRAWVRIPLLTNLFAPNTDSGYGSN